MASGTLEKQTEVVADKARSEASITDAAQAEGKAKVSGSAGVSESRAWNARAQID